MAADQVGGTSPLASESQESFSPFETPGFKCMPLSMAVFFFFLKTLICILIFKNYVYMIFMHTCAHKKSACACRGQRSDPQKLEF